MINAIHRSIILAASCLAPAAIAQLTPDRTYYGVDRPMPMTVAVPAGTKGEATVQLFSPGASEAGARAQVVAGPVDLSRLFPDLAKADAATKLRYAQLVVGEQRVGPPVVLQALLNPPAAVGGVDQQQRREKVTFAPSPGPLSGYRAYAQQNVIFSIKAGDRTGEVEFVLRPDHAPNTCYAIMDLVRGGFYTDVPFHRIVGSRRGSPGFMAQGGDPTGTGQGGPGFNIDLEPSTLPHAFGVLSMARTGYPAPGAPNTCGSQFFICFSRDGTQFLDGLYTAFAEAVKGEELIAALAATPCVEDGRENSKPQTPPRLVFAKLVDAPPFGQGPSPVKGPATLPEQPLVKN